MFDPFYLHPVLLIVHHINKGHSKSTTFLTNPTGFRTIDFLAFTTSTGTELRLLKKRAPPSYLFFDIYSRLVFILSVLYLFADSKTDNIRAIHTQYSYQHEHAGWALRKRNNLENMSGT